MSSKSIITVNTSRGDAEASRDSSEDAWEIKYPWGTDSFSGNVNELINHMEKVIAAHPGEERSYFSRES